MIPSTNFSINSFCGGYDNNFTYLVTCNHTGMQVLIDASCELKKIVPYIRSHVSAVLITHSHSDHIQYLDQYIKAYPNMVVFGHENSQSFSPKKIKPLKNNLKLKIGALVFKSIYTPGHYYDSICYQLNPILFTGDTMFVGRTGRVISNKSNIKDLYNSIYDKILKMPLNTRIFPGHNYGKHSTITLKDNIRISPLLQATSLTDFEKKMEDFEFSRKKQL